MSVSRRELRVLERRLVKIVRNQIINQGLVDTGNMLRSITAKVSRNSRNQMKVEIGGIDYLKYVNGNFDFIGKAKRTRAYIKVENDFNELNKI